MIDVFARSEVIWDFKLDLKERSFTFVVSYILYTRFNGLIEKLVFWEMWYTVKGLGLGDQIMRIWNILICCCIV